VLLPMPDTAWMPEQRARFLASGLGYLDHGDQHHPSSGRRVSAAITPPVPVIRLLSAILKPRGVPGIESCERNGQRTRFTESGLCNAHRRYGIKAVTAHTSAERSVGQNAALAVIPDFGVPSLVCNGHADLRSGARR
jgi:hypothetical protein